jgi:hypothetical protein
LKRLSNFQTTRNKGLICYNIGEGIGEQMTPQTKARRTAMIEQIITDTALDYRFDENSQPRTTDDLKPALDECILLWNRTADRIDKWAAQKPRFADGFIGLRLGWSDALSCKFRLTDGAIRAGAKTPAAYWRAIGVLDYLAEHIATGATKLTVPVELVRWMADFIFMSMADPKLFDRAAHQKEHIWDRRLRHTKRAKGRRTQAFYAEAGLAAEDARQEAEFQSLLRDTLRRDRKLCRDVRLDRNNGDFDFSTAPPNVKIVQLGDHKGFMLVPPRHDRAKRPPKGARREPQKSLLSIVHYLAKLSHEDAALELNQRGIPGPIHGRWTAEAIAHTRGSMIPKRQSDVTREV